MSTLDKYNYTDVYDGGIVVCRERHLPHKSISEEDLKKRQLLFSYHFEGPDHPYAVGKDWMVFKFERNVTISQLQKLIDNPDIDGEAIEHIKRCIKNKKIESD